jgi:UDP-3-O-[3-hydroxymyristoyl] glucosamine N-acyltransferase
VTIGPYTVLEAEAQVGAGSRLSAHVHVSGEAVIGEDCLLHARAYLGRRCVLGDRVILQPGAVVGADGFGYAPVDGVYRKIPQIGIVVVEDDVEIGANACIDRATLGETRIGCGTKIDNLVQIAHNVAIGDHSVLAAQAGVAGSTHLGKRVRLGGQAGLIGHIRVGDDVSVGAQGGVIGDIPEGTTVSGYPARPHREALKVEAQLRRLPELVRRIRELESERKNRESE